MSTPAPGRARRAIKRHLLVALGAALSATALFFLLELSTEFWVDVTEGRKADGLLWRYNVATGSVALSLLVVTMSIGPIRVLRGRHRRAVQLPLRRVTGIWTAVFALLHFPGGLAIHSRGWEVWKPFTRIVPEFDNLVDSFGVAFWAGLIALACLVVLGITSRDGSLRRLGAVRWKRLHRLAYAALGLVAVHALSMQYSERRDPRHATLTAMVLVVAVGLQAAGFVTLRRAGKRARGTARSPESVDWARDGTQDGGGFTETKDAGPATTGDLDQPK